MYGLFQKEFTKYKTKLRFSQKWLLKIIMYRCVYKGNPDHRRVFSELSFSWKQQLDNPHCNELMTLHLHLSKDLHLDNIATMAGRPRTCCLIDNYIIYSYSVCNKIFYYWIRICHLSFSNTSLPEILKQNFYLVLYWVPYL